MSWYTSDEINFIDWLGTGTYTRQSPLTSHLGRDRLTLLKGYRAGISRRVDWESLDQKKIEAHVNNLIRSLEQQPFNQGDK